MKALRLGLATWVFAVVLAAMTPLASASTSQRGDRELRLAVSDAQPLPGTAVTLTVVGPQADQASGGPDTSFERHTKSGWKRLYQLHWTGRGEPTIREANVPTDLIPVGGAQIPVITPAVEPGRYRINRTVTVAASPPLKLSIVIRVKRCPDGLQPLFQPISSPSDVAAIGTPACA